MEESYTIVGDRGRIVAAYKARLSSVWVPMSKEVPETEWFEATILECKYLVNRPSSNPEGFSRSEAKWQYSIPVTVDGRKTRRRPAAWRVPFMEDPAFFNEKEWTVSHLCHDNQCMNWAHHVLEPLAVNKARNGCPAGSHCHHRVKCIRPGPYFDA